MPILDVEIVVGPEESLPDGLARQLADIAGAILESRPGGTWVKLRTLSREQYAENGDLSEDIRPVFVSVLMSKRPNEETIKQQAQQLAEAFAQICQRPKENIHILYEANAAGRIAFGGELVTG